jgi:hypothetical protein
VPRTLEILKCFPNFFQAIDKDKLLYHVVDSIVSRVKEIENDMIRVMKSHWIKAVEDIDDLEKIAALYGIEREEYEDINQFRTKIEDIIRLYLAGPGTVPSVIEFIAIALRKYNIEPKRYEDGSLAIIHCVDGDESRTRCYFKGLDDSLGVNENFIEINENPLLEKSHTENAIRHLHKWSLENRGFFDSYPEITFRGYPEITFKKYDARNINPVIFNRRTGQALGFRGIVPEKSALKLIANEEGFLDTAELDGTDVKSKIFSLKVSQFDSCNFDEDNSRFAIFKPYWVLSKARSAGDKHPQFFPVVPVGESEWEFRIGESTFNGPVFDESTFTFPEKPAGVFDETYFDESVFRIDFSSFNGSKFDEDAFAFPDKLSGIFDEARFDESIYLIDFSAVLEMGWTENQRAMFEVILPYSLGLKQMNATDIRERKRQFMEPLQNVSKIVERVKPIGVKVLIKYNCKGHYSEYQTQLYDIDPGVINMSDY